jgi:hypothetical protein
MEYFNYGSTLDFIIYVIMISSSSELEAFAERILKETRNNFNRG